MKVGFVGIGNMGSAMARNLIKAGLEAAEAAAVPMPIASLVRDRMLAATAQGMGEADWAAIARISFREAGL